MNRLSPGLTDLQDFPYTADEQLHEAAARADKMSIQGVQPKLSARFSRPDKTFTIVDTGGMFIIKPQNMAYRELPQNEDLTMRMASLCGITVPFHGMIYAKDGSLSYFIKRFDREGRKKKIAVEDFAQITGASRDTKYNSSMERVAVVIDRFCTFPAVEKVNLFRLTLFNFLCGNEDMHLKNFSVISDGMVVKLSPAYDLLNTTIAIQNPSEEIALPLNGKKRNLTGKDLIDYFGRERMGITANMVTGVINQLKDSFAEWRRLIDISFLSPDLKDAYHHLLEERRTRLGM